MTRSAKPGRVPAKYSDGVATLTLRVQPGAKRSEMAGFHGTEALRLRVAAPPQEGKANKACARFLAEALGVPISAVTLVRGAGSRDKLMRVESVSQEQFEALLTRWSA